MKSADEIKTGLAYCVEPYCPGEKCPYWNAESCAQDKTYDALALIQQLEERCKHMNDLRDAAAGRALKMEERVHQLEAERDAMKQDLNIHCFTCKYLNSAEALTTVCAECVRWCNWQWRGVHKEE